MDESVKLHNFIYSWYKDRNILKAARFDTPEYIPMVFHINDACWQTYPHDYLFDLMESHKFLFPDFKRPRTEIHPIFDPCSRKDYPFIDDWGCTWITKVDGIAGIVREHPLEDWKDFKNYEMPDPERCMGLGPIDWDSVSKKIDNSKKSGYFTWGGLQHGHTFLKLIDIRGYENLIGDMYDDEPKLWDLINMIERFNSYIVNKYLQIGVDMMLYPEDLGAQKGPLLSPAHFNKYIKPVYRNIMKPARDKGVIVHMHSDGDLRDIIDDIIDSGVEIINLQDLVNGIDWIASNLAGKICIDLDIDRQCIVNSGTPKQIEALIREEVVKIGRKKGGLMMIYGLYPGIPPKNVKVLMDMMEKYAFYYSC